MRDPIKRLRAIELKMARRVLKKGSCLGVILYILLYLVIVGIIALLAYVFIEG